MRNLVLLLILANVVFFAWNQWVAEPPSDGAVQFRQSELGPTLELAPEPGPAPVAGAPDTDIAGVEDESLAETLPEESDAAPEPSPEEPPATAPAACISVGPFEAVERGEGALVQAEELGNEAELRTVAEDVFLGYWVQIRNIATRQEANRQVSVLQEAGFEDAYPLPEDDGERTISLGLFSDSDRAERLREQAAELDLDAEVVPQTREATAWWVDVRLTPDQGPDTFVAVFGEDRVVAGPDAACPR